MVYALKSRHASLGVVRSIPIRT